MIHQIRDIHQLADLHDLINTANDSHNMLDAHNIGDNEAENKLYIVLDVLETKTLVQNLDSSVYNKPNGNLKPICKPKIADCDYNVTICTYFIFSNTSGIHIELRTKTSSR